MTLRLSSATDLIAPHSSLLRLEYLQGNSTSLKGSCSTLLKNTSKAEGSFRKSHFIHIRLQNSSKSCRLNSVH